MTQPTGIAGAQDYRPHGPVQPRCWVCGGQVREASYAARVVPVDGVVQACSKACTEAPKWQREVALKRAAAGRKGHG